MKRPLVMLTLLGVLVTPLAPATTVLASQERSPKPVAGSKKNLAVQANGQRAVARKTTDKAKASVRPAAGAAKVTRVSHAAEPIVTPLRAIATAESDAASDDVLLHSGAVLVLDQQTGEPLVAKNMDVPTSIASITKLMTAMVTLDARLPMGEEITISEADVDRIKGTGSRLALGTRLTREELLHLALIASENRAASALSRAYPGGWEAFIAAMNRKARALGMTQTRFVDGTGLHSGNQSTAADLAKLVDAAYRYPLIREISTTASYDVVVPGTRVVKVKENGKVRTVQRPVQRHVAFVNTNSLVRGGEWDIGLSKTGYIREAGHCLVMQARIAEQRVIIVLLDAVGKWSRVDDATRIRRWLESDDMRRVVSRDHRNSV